VGSQAVHGALVLVTDELDGRSALAKSLLKAGALVSADLPPKSEEAWLRERLVAIHPPGASDLRAVVAALLDIHGADADALLGACELLALYHDDRPITPAGVQALFAGVAEKPVWEVTGAILDGQPRRALELIRAGRLGPEQVLGGLAAEVRRLLACCATPDDAAAAQLVGAKGKPNLYYARRRAAALGTGPLLRLLNGVVQAARQARRSGADPELVIEVLVLHAQRVVRPARR
jgi:DNA polymerase III delta subunit